MFLGLFEQDFDTLFVLFEIRHRWSVVAKNVVTHYLLMV